MNPISTAVTAVVCSLVVSESRCGEALPKETGTMHPPLAYTIKLDTVLTHDDGKFLWYHPRVAAVPGAAPRWATSARLQSARPSLG